MMYDMWTVVSGVRCPVSDVRCPVTGIVPGLTNLGGNPHSLDLIFPLFPSGFIMDCSPSPTE